MTEPIQRVEGATGAAPSTTTCSAPVMPQPPSELPAISVVTPCLNARATVERALESVREQGYPRLEHVISDGGSTDGTLEVLAQDPSLVVRSGPDAGLSDAMNRGIGLATGDVVGWLNADDFYLPGALKLVGDAFAANPGALWLTGVCVIVDGEDREVRKLITRYKRALLRHWSLRSHLIQNYVMAPATFVRREALLELGGFDERFKYSMDYDVWLKLGRRQAPIVIDQPLAAFRMAEGSGSLSMSGFEKQFAEHAQNAREHGDGHRIVVAANLFVSASIVAVYRLMRVLRRRRAD